MDVIKRHIIKAFKDMTAAGNEMASDEESSFQGFSDDENVITVNSRSNSMVLTFIMDTIDDSMTNQNQIDVSSWIVINKPQLKQDSTDNPYSLIITVIDPIIGQSAEQVIADISDKATADIPVDAAIDMPVSAAEEQVNQEPDLGFPITLAPPDPPRMRLVPSLTDTYRREFGHDDCL
jgi:hypothetical protein